MKRILKFFSIIFTLILAFVLIGCEDVNTPSNGNNDNGNQNQNQNDGPTMDPKDAIDYVANLKLDMNSSTLKQVVTIKQLVDGDTTHFYVPKSVDASGILKARYLAINTPESTGKIEEWGKAASEFTKSKLKNATSILIESDDSNWNLDSTGGRYLVWIWYKTNETDDYRNLNLEILQNGLAVASNTKNNRYGETCMNALNQAKALKLKIYSGEKDPDFYYGDAVELTLKELRANIDKYLNVKVAFEANVIREANQTSYVEEYDAETDTYFGMTVYYGFSASGEVLDILRVGNRVRIVGLVEYYEAGGTYQIAGLQYRVMKPDDPSNVQKIGEGYSAANAVCDPDRFINGEIEIVVEDEEGNPSSKKYKYAEMSFGASIAMENLYVKKVTTTTNEDSSSYGAMTLYCTSGDLEIQVRTVVLYDNTGAMVTADAYRGKTIDVVGVVDYYSGTYQIKILSTAGITVLD